MTGEAETLLALLEQRSLSIAALARASGHPRPGLSEALRGLRACSWWYWLDIGDALDLSEDEVGALLEDRVRSSSTGGGTMDNLRRARV